MTALTFLEFVNTNAEGLAFLMIMVMVWGIPAIISAWKGDHDSD